MIALNHRDRSFIDAQRSDVEHPQTQILSAFYPNANEFNQKERAVCGEKRVFTGNSGARRESHLAVQEACSQLDRLKMGSRQQRKQSPSCLPKAAKLHRCRDLRI